MKIITVSGSASGSGKTTVIEKLLKKSLKGWACLKVTVLHSGPCPTGRNCGACDEAPSKFAIINNKDIIEEKGKDTARYKKAGAGEVLWLKSKPRYLKQALREAISRFRNAKGVIIETTSGVKHLNPDLSIFVRGRFTLL